MHRFYFFAPVAVAILLLTACTSMTDISGKISNLTKGPSSEDLVNASLKTIEKLKQRSDLKEFEPMLKNAAGVAIFPAVIKAGFIFAAEGGTGLLMARDASGNWGYPAFYTMAAGSYGFQAGGQKAEVVLIIRRLGAVEAIISHQAKIGADAGITVGKVGTGLEGSITTNLGPDIVAFTDAKGLFGGISLEGSAIIRRNDLNSQYYGDTVAPRDIVIGHQHRNRHADALRATLVVP